LNSRSGLIGLNGQSGLADGFYHAAASKPTAAGWGCVSSGRAIAYDIMWLVEFMISVQMQEVPDGLLLAPTPRQRWGNFAVTAGLAALLGIIAVGSALRSPVDRQGVFWGSLLGGIVFFYGLAFAQRWVEILVHLDEKRIICRRHRGGNRWVVEKRLPFTAVKAVRVARRERLGYSSPEPYGRLQFLLEDGSIWTFVDFDDLHSAQRARKRVLHLLGDPA